MTDSERRQSAAERVRCHIHMTPAQLGTYDVVIDALTLADAFPADSELAITEAWLRSVGGEPPTNEDTAVLYFKGGITVIVWPTIEGFFFKGVSLPPIKTRGDLRALCQALRIPLTPATEEPDRE